jgi:hypothetical protein
MSWLVALVALALGAGLLAAAPAQASFPKTAFHAGSTDIHADGHFIWENRSVQVGGSVTGDGTLGASVVFTAFDGSGHVVARAARPGDNKYTGGVFSYGFTLDASSVVGGIRSIEVDLWGKSGTNVFLDDFPTYFRP